MIEFIKNYKEDIVMKIEQNYDFRKEMCNPHKRIIRDKNEKPKENEYEIKDGVTVSVDTDESCAILAAKDFVKYLKTAFGIKAKIDTGRADIIATVKKSGLGENANGYMGRRVTVSDSGIVIEAYDPRGIAQAFYSLEDDMNARRAPFLSHGAVEKRPAFSPRMIHSGYGIDEYPDEYLSVCAHHGYDAIIIFVKDATHSAHGECDFNDIVKRAAKYGIDTYAYSYLKNFVHPEDDGAKEIYRDVYGTIFREIKGLKGMIFVGESIEFPSRDPHVCPRFRSTLPEDGLPDGRITPGWWPCNDYPQWVSLVRDSIREVSPDADVVFWTYNFGYVEEKYRLELINTLPTDISLLVTFDMFAYYKMGDGFGQVMDYSISHVGPGSYFTSEAAVAKQRGIRLYSMVNTAGRTWDYGVAPYEPFPYQWNERHEKIMEAREKYGLSGLMESHHFGFTPSFITKIAKENYTIGGKDFEDYMLEIAKGYAKDDYEKFLEGMRIISESIKYYVPSDESQYGPFRIGPAYPLCLQNEYKLPDQPGAHFGNRIYYTMAGEIHNLDHWGAHSPYSVRVEEEIECATKTKSLLQKGLGVLRSIRNKNEELKKLINLVDFLVKCNVTAINAKKFYLLRAKLYAETKAEKLIKITNEIEKIARAEIKNAEQTIPLVERDSAIGFEPSMLYQCDKRGLLWKIKQVNYMLNFELPRYRVFERNT